MEYLIDKDNTHHWILRNYLLVNISNIYIKCYKIKLYLLY